MGRGNDEGEEDSRLSCLWRRSYHSSSKEVTLSQAAKCGGDEREVSNFLLGYPNIGIVIKDDRLGKTESFEKASKLLKPVIFEVHSEWIAGGGWWNTNSKGYGVIVPTNSPSPDSTKRLVWLCPSL
jgi:hypothetical protein